MQLSTHFSLAEFTHSQTAARMGIGNTPPPSVMPALQRTAEGMEGVRMRLGNRAVIISSGYRSPALNAAIGSRPTSQHVTGQAADFTCPAYGTVDAIMRRIVGSDIAYDQCILEFGAWVHISFSDAPRRQALVIDATGTKAYP